MPNVFERLTITIEEAGHLLGISRGSAYQAVREGQLPTIRLGRRLVVPVEALKALLASTGNNYPTASKMELVAALEGLMPICTRPSVLKLIEGTPGVIAIMAAKAALAKAKKVPIEEEEPNEV